MERTAPSEARRLPPQVSMTTSQIVRLLKGRRAGPGKWMALCPVHREKTRSLSIREGKGGDTLVHCFGCLATVHQLADVMGLTVGDFFARKREMTPAIRRQMADEDRLKLLERRHGLAIMAQAVLPEERRYWARVEQNIAVEIEGLRTRMFPIEAARIRRESETQRIIRVYGFDELWSVIP